MKKFVPYIIAVVVIAGLGAAFMAAKKDNNLVTSKPDTSAAQSTSGGYDIVKACDVVTQADADALLGAGAKKGDNSIGDTSSDDINVSTCSYSQSTSFKSLTLLARSAKTSDGSSSNHAQFTTGLPATAQHISGYGDDAYWDPTYGQLNILAHDNWYILSIGGLKPSDKTLDDAKAFGTRVASRL